jgi:polyhydroxybutyrate depolymerase
LRALTLSWLLSAAAVSGQTPSSPRLSAGCQVKGSPTGQQLRQGMKAGGKSGRRWSYSVPATYDPSHPGNTPLALVFDFHGIGGVIQEPPYLITSRSVLQSESQPALFVFPQGIDPKGGKGHGWWGITHCADYDLAFFDAILAELSARYCVDLNRVFAGGFSFGAAMSQTLACCRGDKLRAIAPQSGGPSITTPIKTCPTKAWPSARYSYGTGDKNTAGGDGAFTLEALRGVVEQSRRALGCSTKTTPVPTRCDATAPKCECLSYAGCREGTSLVRCEYPGSGGDMHMVEQPDYARNVWGFYSGLK